MSTTLADDLGQQLRQITADVNHIPGAILAVVDRNGTLLVHDASGVRQAGSAESMDKDALCWMASCTKLITAIAVMQLVEQGTLHLDKPVHDVVPSIKTLEQPFSTPITLRHLLTHTAGMSYPFFNRDTKAWFAQRNMTSFCCKIDSLNGPLNAEPGTRWEYGCSIDWAGLAVEAASGVDLDTYFRQHIFAPLGIKRITLKPQTGLPSSSSSSQHGASVLPHLVGMNFRDNATGTISPQKHVIEQDESKMELVYGGAGAYGNAAEYTQILCALLNDGTHPTTGARILTAASVEELFRDQLDDKLVKDLDRPIDDAEPDLTNAFTIPGGVKQWCFAGLKAYDGPEKKHSFVWWAGIANHYWIINRELGFGAMIQVQLFPFCDSYVIGSFFGPINTAVQTAFAASAAAKV